MFHFQAKACNHLSEHIVQCMHTVSEVGVPNGDKKGIWILSFLFFPFDFLLSESEGLLQGQQKLNYCGIDLTKDFYI